MVPKKTPAKEQKMKNAGDVSVSINGKDIKLPVLEGTENERALDISRLRVETKYITLDPGFVNTGSCSSAITYLDGEKGILRYRGIPIEELAEHSTFTEVAFLLIYGYLPVKQELDEFNEGITHHSMIHEDMKRFFNGYPATAHPMSILSSMICSLASFYPDCLESSPTPQQVEQNIIRLLAKVCTIAAFSYKKHNIRCLFGFEGDGL